MGHWRGGMPNMRLALNLTKASDLKRRFNRVKYQQFPWLTNIHRDAHAQPFADLSKAFRNFFAGRARHPRFNKKGKCRDSF